MKVDFTNTTRQKVNIVLPVSSGEQARALLPLALALRGNEAESQVHLLGMARVPEGGSLSEGALPMQRLRQTLEGIAAQDEAVNRLTFNMVSHNPWHDIERLIDERNDDRDLLLLPWLPNDAQSDISAAEALARPPCDVVVANIGAPMDHVRKILLPLRGGAYAGLALRLAVRMARALNAEVTLLRVLSETDDEFSRILRRDFTGLAGLIPEIAEEIQVVGDPIRAIERELAWHQAVVLGASAIPNTPTIGRISQNLLARKNLTTLVVRTREAFQMPASAAQKTPLPISVRVDKWFAENTFSCGEFSDMARLLNLKAQQKVTISLALPALNEEASVGAVIQSVLPLRECGLVDEIVLIDSNSTDRTRDIAESMGVAVYIHQDVLPNAGPRRGKGEALWKSLQVTQGDIIAWIDTDIINPHPRFVYGILGPLLENPRVQYVKGFYQRPIAVDGKLQASGGGRVTELLARPMFNLFFPELSGFVQPLAGEYAGRREALERVPFYSGYGVESGLLLDLLAGYGLDGLAQVDLEERVHRNQELQALSKMSFALLQVFFDHLKKQGVVDSSKVIEPTMKLLRIDGENLRLEEVDIHERWREPMKDVEGYWRSGR
ncbi:MAG TPA: glucosyl-3-phosphoglycerate synthase [Thermoflexales bacterium]|nr:glucosyl-3-phosphoglycerate synthase [Thermoflexales bacterium]HQZ99004.1 glucosyl-3-phosphoglycerate synthase [Thermoflexales bacterium]